MKPRGTYKLLGQHRARAVESPIEPFLGDALRSQRIVDSLRCEISNDERVQEIRIRQIFSDPCEIFRIEVEVPELGYLRTTLLDRDALEELLEADEVRARLTEPFA